MKFIDYILVFSLVFFLSCSNNTDIQKKSTEYPDIFPDYTEVTIPVNIAPLNFSLKENPDKAILLIENENQKIKINSREGEFLIPEGKWKRLLTEAKGKTLHFTVSVKKKNEWIRYKPFSVNVSADPIDSYIAYRLIPPGYELWSKMGIYQRNLENYRQSAIYENYLTKENCVNCHSFPLQNPDKMLFHMRQTYPGTMLIDNGKIEKLNTKTAHTLSALVYPSWHPSGDFIAFSVNKTMQLFHQNHKNRIEVYDLSSDAVVYDVKKHEITTSPLLSQKGVFETFPTFSPDGETLYFCTADSVNVPSEYQQVKYSLCSIGFDPHSRTFGDKVDTLFNAAQHDKSVSFPRVSPDGKWLMFTLSEYGNFSIWHKDADLWMLNLATKEIYPLNRLTSHHAVSYPSWSHNSRWVVFSSRRIDGLYTRPFFAHINDDGNPEKPFLLPQRSTKFYNELLYSYNIPEFITGKVEVSKHKIAQKAIQDKGIDVKFSPMSE